MICRFCSSAEAHRVQCGASVPESGGGRECATDLQLQCDSAGQQVLEASHCVEAERLSAQCGGQLPHSEHCGAARRLLRAGAGPSAAPACWLLRVSGSGREEGGRRGEIWRRTLRHSQPKSLH